MSKKTRRVPSFKALKSQYDEIAPVGAKHLLIVSSPAPSAALASALICKARLDSNSLFHVTTSEPVLDIDSVNELRKTYEKAAILLVGIDVVGGKRLRKGKSYPILIGGESDSEHVMSLTIGNRETVAAAAYAYVASSSDDISDSEYLQLAAAGSLVDSYPNPQVKGASMELVESAKKKNLIEERKGFRLFGVNFMPLNEVLTYSIRPYLQSLSGVTDACDKLCTDADIPFSKFRMPLSALSNDEAQRLNKYLLPMLEPEIIPYALGLDFILMEESEDSPARLLSGIKALGEAAWSFGESGASAAVWMGDRARILRVLLDSYMTYTREVISGVEEAINVISKTTIPEVLGALTKIPLKSIRKEALADVGRILIESGKVETDVIALTCEGALGAIWKSNTKSLQDVIVSLRGEKLEPISTSSQSVGFSVAPEQNEEVLQVLQKLW